MSEEKSEPVIAGAICGPPPRNDEAGGEVQQPRQPTNIQGLLKYCMEATKSEDPTQEPTFKPMDEAKRKFLEEAISALTVDVVEVLLTQIKILQDVEGLKEGEDASKYVGALQTIADFVCDIDTANDFHKIGGFSILKPCLRCVNPQVRALACNLLAELTQNNPYCQRVALDNGLMPILVKLVEEDKDVNVTVKALYAISCLVRDNNAGIQQLIQYCGIQVLLEALKRNEEKCTIKISFLLAALCSYPDFKSRLIFVGYLPVLMSLITSEHKPTDEHVLYLLLKLVEDNPSAVNEFKSNYSNFKDVLQGYINIVRNQEDYTNEEEYSLRLQNLLFPRSQGS